MATYAFGEPSADESSSRIGVLGALLLAAAAFASSVVIVAHAQEGQGPVAPVSAEARIP